MLDLFICTGYVAAIFCLGAWFYRDSRSQRAYFLAGRSIGWLPIGLSLMITLASSLGFVAVPTAGYRTGLMMLWSLLALPLSFPVVVWVFMPFYHRLASYSAYAYLERRFDLRVRLLASGLFICWRITWMAASVYVPAMVLHTLSGQSFPIWVGVVGFGAIATVYTALGGMKAVIWTDVAQFGVLFGGVLAVLLVAAYGVEEGWLGIWSVARDSGHTALSATLPGWKEAGAFERLKLYLYSDFTAGAIIVGFTLGKFGNYCVDQVMVQRYLSARSLRAAQLGFLTNCISFAVFFTLMTLVGVALFAFSKAHDFPQGMRPDQLFPYFIARHLPAGVSGLVLAALTAAAMSSIDAGVNSCVAAITTDFYGRLRARVSDTPLADARLLRLSRWLSCGIGAVVIILASFVGRLGDAFQIALQLVNAFIGPLFGLFVLGMFSRRIGSGGAFWAALSGSAITALTIVAEPVAKALAAWDGGALASRAFALFDVGFLWTSSVGFVVTIAIGAVFCLIGNANSAWTFRGVMQQTEESQRSL